MGDSVLYEWKKIRYTGDLARNAIALANGGVGYVLLESGKDRGELFAIVAYKQTLDGPIPDHVESLTDYEIKRVESVNKRRHDYGPKNNQNPPEYYHTK